jgi:hypothetical protein
MEVDVVEVVQGSGGGGVRWWCYVVDVLGGGQTTDKGCTCRTSGLVVPA